MLLGLIVTRSNPRTGWFGVLLFGVMTTLAAYDLFTLRNHKIVKGEGSGVNIRSSLIWSGTILISLFFGVLERILAELAIVRLSVMGLWLATFVVTLAFYPFRGKEVQDDIPTFKIWILFSAIMGVVSIGASHLSRWLD